MRTILRIKQLRPAATSSSGRSQDHLAPHSHQSWGQWNRKRAKKGWTPISLYLVQVDSPCGIALPGSHFTGQYIVSISAKGSESRSSPQELTFGRLFVSRRVSTKNIVITCFRTTFCGKEKEEKGGRGGAIDEEEWAGGSFARHFKILGSNKLL